MARKIFICVVILLARFAFSQSYHFPESFSNSYNFKPEEAGQQLLSSPEAKNNPAKFEEYIVNYLYGTQYRFDNDRIYMDWPEIENYLIRLMDTLMPKNKERGNLDVFLNRSLSANASASMHGFVYLNIGMLASAADEAELAYVISHHSAHYLFRHTFNNLSVFELFYKYRNVYSSDFKVLFAKKAREEAQADSFSVARIQALGYDTTAIIQKHEMLDMQELAYRYSIPYKDMLKASSAPPAAYESKERKRRNHVSAKQANKAKKDNACKNCIYKYRVDSALFVKYKKIAREECKKIAFENALYKKCLTMAFIDYLYQPKNLKNLYLVCECLRRIMYVDQKLIGKGFLADDINDLDLLDYNHSVLYKPYYLFDDPRQYADLAEHPFFTNEQKPFNTYEQAFVFFTRQALALNMNEANFSVALFHYSINNMDSCKKYLDIYLRSGRGIHVEFAKVLVEKGKPSLPGGKMMIVYNNVGNYTGYEFNYYLAQKRKKYNAAVKKSLVTDTANTRLVFVNDLMGTRPRELYEFQMLENNIHSLFDEIDVEVFKKKRLNARETMDELELSRQRNKHLLIYAPEWYTWMKEKNVSKIFDVELIYQYREYMKEEEYFNNYLGYYLDVNAPRPYFKDGVRNGFLQKEKESEIHSHLNYFLYGNE